MGRWVCLDHVTVAGIAAGPVVVSGPVDAGIVVVVVVAASAGLV